MKEDICEAISKHTPFSVTDIGDSWELCKSWDLVIQTCEFAQAMGMTLTQAIQFAVSAYLTENSWQDVQARKIKDIVEALKAKNA